MGSRAARRSSSTRARTRRSRLSRCRRSLRCAPRRPRHLRRSLLCHPRRLPDPSPQCPHHPRRVAREPARQRARGTREQSPHRRGAATALSHRGGAPGARDSRVTRAVEKMILPSRPRTPRLDAQGAGIVRLRPHRPDPRSLPRQRLPPADRLQSVAPARLEGAPDGGVAGAPEGIAAGAHHHQGSSSSRADRPRQDHDDERGHRPHQPVDVAPHHHGGRPGRAPPPEEEGADEPARGRDAHADFASALKGSLREDPDVIAVGELRDMETVRMAVPASETGHLVSGR